MRALGCNPIVAATNAQGQTLTRCNFRPSFSSGDAHVGRELVLRAPFVLDRDRREDVCGYAAHMVVALPNHGDDATTCCVAADSIARHSSAVGTASSMPRIRRAV